MGSGISTKYQIDSSYGTYYVSEREQQYSTKIERVFDEDYLNEFCNEKISQKPIEGSSIESNYQRVQDKYPLRTGGNFGDKTKESGRNEFFCDNPMHEAMDLYSELSYGGATQYTQNRHGILTKLCEGTILFRPYTSTVGSPAVEIKIIGMSILRSQKIHFLIK